MATALVTGVAGFLGSHAAQQCLDLGMNVVGLDDLSGGYVDNVPPKVKFVRGSILDKNLLDNIWKTNTVDYVYHFAAYAAEGLSHFIRGHNYQVNLIGSINLINRSIIGKVKCFVFASSIAVYGAYPVPITEEMQPKPEDPYGISKYAIELDLEAAHRIFGLPYIIFRLHNVYGEKQNLYDKYRNVIGIFIMQTLNDAPMTIFGNGLQTRAFSYVHDVVPIIVRSPFVDAAHQQVFNLGDDRVVTIQELTIIIATALQKECKVIYLPPRKEVIHAVASHNKLRDFFGNYTITTLEDGIQNMAKWALSEKQLGKGHLSNIQIEIDRELPPSWRNQV